MFQESCTQTEVSSLHLGGGPSSAELRDTACIFLEKEPGPCPKAVPPLDCSSPVFVSPPFPDQQLFKSALWNSGKVKEAERSLYPTDKKQGTQKGLVLQSCRALTQF